MVINHNMSAIFANNRVGFTENNLQKTMERLSSGERINRAGDDASGLAVSEKMRTQIRGLNKATENITNGVSFIQTTEAYLQSTTDILQRIRELSVQSANGIYSDEDRMQIQVEVSSLVAEVDRIASSAQFNGFNMLTGRFANENSPGVMQFQVGANMDQNIRIYVGDMSASALGLKGSQEDNEAPVSVSDPTAANYTIGIVDEALKNVNKQRADLGAYQNRLESAAKTSSIAAENLQASESRIRDADMAKDVVELTRQNILQNAGVAMLGQANSQAQNVLALLK